MFVIGITGGIGSGKSTAANILRNWGINVLDADAISHMVTAKDGLALPEIQAVFGNDILDSNQELNRAKLSHLVFQNRMLLDKLSLIVHKHVFAYIGSEINRLSQAKIKVCALDVPIPSEEGFIDRSDVIIAINTPKDIRIKRLISRGMNPEEAEKRMLMQLTDQAYAKIANFVVDNSGSKEELESKLKDLLFPMLQTRGIKVDCPN